jgi:predicted SprT family Zn-dependent metalloprotease
MPPVGWPVQYRVSGPDISEVREIALKLAAVMSANPHTVRVQKETAEYVYRCLCDPKMKEIV